MLKIRACHSLPPQATSLHSLNSQRKRQLNTSNCPASNLTTSKFTQAVWAQAVWHKHLHHKHCGRQALMVASNCPTSKCPLAFAHEQIGTSICPNAVAAGPGAVRKCKQMRTNQTSGFSRPLLRGKIQTFNKMLTITNERYR